MSANSSTNPHHAPKAVRYLLLTAALLTFLLMVMGALTRTGGAASACPDWPTCFGSLALPTDDAAALQVAHRWLAGLTALLTWAAGFAALRWFRSLRARFAGQAISPRDTATPLARPILIAVLAAGLIMLAEVTLGAAYALSAGGPAAWLTPLHLTLAILALGLLTTAAAAAIWSHAYARAPRPAIRTPFTRLSLAAVVAVFLLMLSGALVSATDAVRACSTWPLCQPQGFTGWLALAHRAITLLAAALTTLVFFKAWRTQRSQSLPLTAATAAFVMMLGQALLGGLAVSRGFPADLAALHSASSAALWAAQVLTLVGAALSGRAREDELAEAAEPLPSSWGSRLKDFVLLNKPIIVALLLVTTYAGMVVGGGRIPGLPLTLWTMLGGALAAGGSSALNQYIDRETDKAMQRTAKRPIPDGRLKPAEGLAYGVGAVLASFFLLAGTVNLLAALLSLAGAIYYVLLYSVWLKYATVQNIVIGGGAGAIPPLVGWAAATGSLNAPSLFLFAIVFLWTPPHFWALALVRKNDYARGKVPMLPVVRGEETTRKQVFIYTLELVALTLLMPLAGLGGSLYLVLAAALGLWLIAMAWRVLKVGGNKAAWTMYRASSMYLMFLFAAMVVDVLI